MTKAYADAGDNAKSLEAYRNYLDKHGGTAEQFWLSPTTWSRRTTTRTPSPTP